MVSPQLASHTPSPHLQVGGQSCGQVALVSPQVGEHTPLPHTHEGQSLGQLVVFSPQLGSQIWLPHEQLVAQSVGQESTVSPHWG